MCQTPPILSSKGFTLIELLIVIAIIGLLISIIAPTMTIAKDLARSTVCQTQMRNIMFGTLLYAEVNKGLLPRSSHSALYFKVMPWGYALSPFLGFDSYSPGAVGDQLFKNQIFNGIYRCPKDERREKEWSYGKNVYTELLANETGGPTWWRTEQIPQPAATIFFSELRGNKNSMADHIMAHFWSEGGNPEVDANRHMQSSNYAYIDGHAGGEKFLATYDPDKCFDNWNPKTAQ